MRRKASGLRLLHLFWALCLCAPPTVRLWLDFSSEASRPQLTSGRSTVRLAALESRLREAEDDLRALDITLRRDEYEPVLARVFSRDPASTRSALLVGIRSEKPVPADITALTEDHHLLGRVLDVVAPAIGVGGFAVAQVQTLLDTDFRVRVLVGETPGLAAGTGVATEDGHPLLKILVLDGPRELREGDVVRTEGASGVFAPGIPVGSISLEDRVFDRRDGHRYPLIRSEVVIEHNGRIVPRQIVLLRDAMHLSAARVRRKS